MCATSDDVKHSDLLAQRIHNKILAYLVGVHLIRILVYLAAQFSNPILAHRWCDGQSQAGRGHLTAALTTGKHKLAGFNPPTNVRFYPPADTNMRAANRSTFLRWLMVIFRFSRSEGHED